MASTEHSEMEDGSCGVSFGRECTMESHFSCSFCQARFHGTEKLLSHIMSHTGDNEDKEISESSKETTDEVSMINDSGNDTSAKTPKVYPVVPALSVALSSAINVHPNNRKRTAGDISSEGREVTKSVSMQSLADAPKYYYNGTQVLISEETLRMLTQTQTPPEKRLKLSETSTATQEEINSTSTNLVEDGENNNVSEMTEEDGNQIDGKMDVEEVDLKIHRCTNDPDNCHYKTNVLTNYKQHVMVHHRSKVDRRIATMYHYTSDQIEEHIEFEKNPITSVLQCVYCVANFNDQLEGADHLEEHRGEKEFFSCRLHSCKFGSSQLADIVMHVVEHLGIVNYEPVADDVVVASLSEYAQTSKDNLSKRSSTSTLPVSMNEQEPHKTDAKEIQTEVDGKERSRDDESGNVTVIGAMEEEKSGDTRITALPSSQQSEQVDVQNTSQSQDTGGDDVEKRLENLSCNTKTGREEVATVDEEVVDIGVQNDSSKEMELHKGGKIGNDSSKEMELHEGGKTGDEVVETVVQNDSKDVELDEEQKTEDLGNKQISEKRIVEVGENEKDAIKDFEGSDGKEQDSLLDTEKKDSKEMQIPVVANIEGENSTSTVAVFKNVDFIVNEKVVAMERPLIEELEERKDLACNKCSAKFSKVVHAIEHRRLHHGVKPFTCSYCAFQAAQESVVRTHVFRKHQLILRGTSTNKLIHDLATNTFSCPFCPSPKVKFLLLKDAEEHLKSQHVFLEDQQYVCYVCGLESTVRKDIVNHALYSRCKHKNQEASTDKIVKKVAQDIVELSHKYSPAEEWHEMLHPDVIIDSEELGDKNQDKENQSNSAQNDTRCKIVELDAAADTEKMQFKCTLCDFASVQRRKVYYHIIDSHKRCQRDCYDTYTYVIGEVEQNISLSRNPITGLYHCPFCDEVSKRQSTGVIVHIRAIHSKERPYKCKYCSYDSVSWSEIFSHGKAWHDVEIHSMIKQIPFFEYVSSLDEKSIVNDGMEVEGSSQTETKSKTVEQKEMSRDKSWVVEESWTAGFGTSFTIKKKGLGSGSSSGTSNNEEAVKSNAGTSNNEEIMETNTAAKPDTKITNAARLETDDTEVAEVDHNIREIFQKANLNVDYIINISDIEKLAVSDAQLSRLHFCDKCDIVIQGMGPDMIFYSGHGCKEDDLVWFCSHCICGFKNKAELVDHLKAKHSIDHKSSGVTLQLNQALLHHLVRHIRVVHLQACPPFVCMICDFRSMSGEHLNFHLNLCHAKIATELPRKRGDVLKHREEEQENQRWCKENGIDAKTLKDKYMAYEPVALPKSMRKLKCPVMDEYACAFCRSTFKVWCSLKHHVRCHMNDKPFKCLKCQHTMASKSEMINHIIRSKCRSNDVQGMECDDNGSKSKAGDKASDTTANTINPPPAIQDSMSDVALEAPSKIPEVMENLEKGKHYIDKVFQMAATPILYDTLSGDKTSEPRTESPADEGIQEAKSDVASSATPMAAGAIVEENKEVKSSKTDSTSPSITASSPVDSPAAPSDTPVDEAASTTPTVPPVLTETGAMSTSADEKTKDKEAGAMHTGDVEMDQSGIDSANATTDLDASDGEDIDDVVLIDDDSGDRTEDGTDGASGYLSSSSNSPTHNKRARRRLPHEMPMGPQLGIDYTCRYEPYNVDMKGSMSHQCSYCGRDFASANNLNIHIRTHTGEKPYRCLHCGFESGYDTSIRRHFRLNRCHVLRAKRMVMSNSASISVSASASCANKLIVSAEKAKEEAENFLQTIKEERAKTYKNSPDDLQIVREKSADKAAIMDTTTNKQTASPDLVNVKGLEGSKKEDAHEAKESVTKQLDTEIEQNPMKKLHKMSSELGYQIAPVVGYQATSPVIPVAGIHYTFTPSHIEQSAVATLRSSQFFDCMVCEKRSNTLYDAITHLRGHTGDKPFHCCFCNYITAHELAIKNHFQLKHASHEFPNDKDNEEQTSDKYDETINPPPAGPPAPRSHSSESDDVPPTNSANEDTTEKDPLQPEWPAFFANRRYIDFDFCISEKESEAVATFLKSGSYRCEVCNIKLSNRFGVTSHIRKHFNDKPYVCIHCKCTFDSANACVTHLDQYHKLGKLPPMYDPAVHVLAGVPSSPPSSVGKTETFSSETHQVSGIAEEKMQLEPQWPIHFAAKRDIDFTFTMSVFEKAALRKFFHAGVYLCDTCSFKCATRIDVTAHVRRHNKEKPYQCLHCSAGFDSAMPMMAHCDMHQKEDNSQTEVEENTSTPQQSPMPESTINESSDQDEDKKSAVMNSLGLYGMDSIKQEVKNTEVYQFPVRGKDYTVKESVYLLKLRAHLSTLSKFACEFCHTESPTVDEAIDHMAQTHALPGGFRREFHCVMCTEKFSDEKFMRNHIVVHHTRSANMAEKLVISKSTTRQTGEEYLCLVCGKVTKTEWDSELHKRQCPGAQNEFFCTMCSFKSPSLGAMSTHCHMKHTTHLQLERDPFTGNYICTFCSLVWPQADEDAKAHSCKMNGIGTWYVCKDCNFTSVEKSVVLLHKLFYHSDRAEEFVLPGQLVNIAASKTETGSQKYEIGTADPSSETTNQVASPVGMQASPTSSMASPAGVQVSPSTQMVSPHAQEYQHQAVLSQMAYVKAAKNFVEHSQANIKPPKAPAKPITAYIRYSKDKYKEVKAKYPDLGVGSIGRIIGAQWHALTAEEKSKYTEEYMKDKERYQQEMMKYHESAEYKAYAKARASAALSVLPHPLTKNFISSPPTPPSQTSDQDVMLISPGHPSTDIPDRIMEKSYRCNKCGCRFKLQSEHKYHMTHYHSTQTDMKWEEQLQQMASPQSRESFQDQRRQMIAAQSYPAPSYSTNNMMAQPPSSYSQQPMPVPTGIFTSQFYEEQLASSADSAETDDNDVLEDMTSTTGSTMDERLDSATPITSSTSLQMPVIANVISLSE